MLESKVPIEVKHTLKDLRVRAGLNQKEASKKLSISVPTLDKWEKDSSNLRMSEIFRIVEVYSIPQDYIFFGTNNAFSEKMNSAK